MTTLLELPDELMGAVERRAARDGHDLAFTVAELLRKGLEVPESFSKATSGRITTDHVTGLPRVVCEQDRVGNLVRDPATGLLMAVCAPGAPVEKMSIEEILAMEYATLFEDDLERYGLPVRHEPVDRSNIPEPSPPLHGSR